MRGRGLRSPGPRRRLALEGAHLDRMAAWARDARPAEACGLLVGRRGGGERGITSVRRVLRVRNLCAGRHPDRFELDPGELVAAADGARAEGLVLVGVWHSHPEAPARLSARDRAGAWEGHSQLVLSLAAGGEIEVRSFRRCGGRFREEAVRVRRDPRPCPRIRGR